MKSLSVSLAVLALAVASGCAGPAGPGATSGVTPPSGAPATTGAQPSQAAAPTAVVPVPQPGASVATVTLTGGADAGTYTAAPDLEPNCTYGLIGPQGWGVQLSNLVAGDKELGSVQLVAAAPGMADDEDAFFRGTEFLMTVTIGPSLGENSRNYEVAVRTELSDQESSGTGSAQVSDTGSTAVIHATGTTADGVGIDATVNCPSVSRQ